MSISVLRIRPNFGKSDRDAASANMRSPIARWGARQHFLILPEQLTFKSLPTLEREWRESFLEPTSTIGTPTIAETALASQPGLRAHCSKRRRVSRLADLRFRFSADPIPNPPGNLPLVYWWYYSMASLWQISDSE
jgi:hypothetical protein